MSEKSRLCFWPTNLFFCIPVVQFLYNVVVETLTTLKQNMNLILNLVFLLIMSTVSATGPTLKSKVLRATLHGSAAAPRRPGISKGGEGFCFPCSSHRGLEALHWRVADWPRGLEALGQGEQEMDSKTRTKSTSRECFQEKEQQTLSLLQCLV